MMSRYYKNCRPLKSLFQGSHNKRINQIQERSYFYSKCISKQLALKINNSPLSSFTLIQKHFINKHRINLFLLLFPIVNRKKAISEYIKIAIEWNQMLFLPYWKINLKCYQIIYQTQPSIQKIIKEYTKQGFHFYFLNRALRRKLAPRYLFPFRQPFQDLFYAILELYALQESEGFRQQNFSCWRGCFMPQEEFEVLAKNTGRYIQLEGFTSTSLCKELATQKFMKNTLIRIKVKADNLGGQMDPGFASIQSISAYSEEREILFNSANFFKIIDCRKAFKQIKLSNTKTSVMRQYIVLEYAPVSTFQKRELNFLQLEEIQKQMMTNYLNQQKQWQDGPSFISRSSNTTLENFMRNLSLENS